MILDTIAESTRRRVEEKKRIKPQKQVMKEAFLCTERNRDEGKRFEQALSGPGISFICEVKKASPSKGLIAQSFPYRDIAAEYEKGGADAISVLTEPEFFLGDDRYLQEISQTVSIPVLRKDFTVDAYQIYEAKTLGAGAVLLICSLLDQEQLARYIRLSGELGLGALVEAHSGREVTMAMEAGARIIGINNRNLKTFEVDFSNALKLRKLVDQDTVFVAESGITTPQDIKALADAKVNAVLIGEILMKASDRIRTLEELRGKA